MADYIQKDNSGTIFKNDRKEKESHPDGKGSCVIDGVEYWVSSWNKTSTKGTQYRSLSFQRKEQAQVAPPARQAPPRSAPQKGGSGFDDMEDGVPW